MLRISRWVAGRARGPAILVAVIVATTILAQAQTAAASWQQDLNLPGIAGQQSWSLSAESCTRSGRCLAIGSDSSSTADGLFAEVSHGGGWTLTSAPVTVGYTPSFSALSCSSADACMAVGQDYTGTAADTRTLAEFWNGGAWKVLSTPTPPGATLASLDDVVCASAKSCLAVGYWSDGTKQVALSEIWNGTSWTTRHTPDPAGATITQLNGVACPSATGCIAVGYAGPDSAHYRTLAEAWNGSSWKIQRTPNPASFDQLNDIACTSATACEAVGDQMAAHWNGTTWTAQKVPDAPQDTGGFQLSAISCPAANACAAVGGYYQDSVQNVVAASWNGSVWSTVVPNLGTASVTSWLSDLACSRPGACTAVGTYQDPTNGNRALVEDFSLTWQQQFGAVPSQATSSALDGVWCWQPNRCHAVGNFRTSRSSENLAETFNGSNWAVNPTPHPVDSQLIGISCHGANRCTAVGHHITPGGIQTLAERWNGTTWAPQSTPHPAGARGSDLLAVSCPSSTSCTAVGYYIAHTGNQRPLAESWNGIRWTIKPAPNPAGTARTQLRGVSCTSAGPCMAVGTAGSAKRYKAFAERWNGSVWAITSAPSGAEDGDLDGVSCTSSAYCVAVGSSPNPGGYTNSIAVKWNGSRWSTETVPRPAGSLGSSLTSVTCMGAGLCTAVGLAEPDDVTTTALAEGLTGTAWKVQPTPTIAGAESVVLSSVSCASPGMCMAVGWDDSSGAPAVLTEEYS
jgi:hypothetical protein